MDLNITELSTKSVDDLFKTYSIQELEELKVKLQKHVSSKKSELRTLVGFKYRDLLKVADDIIKMNELTKLENDKLVELTFKKSNYNNKSLKNLSNFNQFQTSEKIETAKIRNRSKILKNIVHDLNCLFLNLKISLSELAFDNKDETTNTTTQDSENPSSSISESISNSFINISKHFYLIDYFFKDELTNNDSSDSFTIKKYNSLRLQFLKEIEKQIVNLIGDNEFEFSVNIMISYIITKKVSPFDAIIWYLDIRYNKIIASFQLKNDSQNCLNYIFNTLNYLSIFKSKIPTFLIRLTHNSSNSNWVSNTSFRKYTKWLDISKNDFKVMFPLSISDIKSSITDNNIDPQLGDWKLKVGSFFYTEFTESFKNVDNLNNLVILLNKILQSFKNFTSLVDLKYNDNGELLIDSILKIWKLNFLNILKMDLNQFDEISISIVENFNNFENLQLIKTNNGLNLFKFTDMTDIDVYISQTSNPTSNNNTIESILNNLRNFKKTLNVILNSLQSLNKLSVNLSKPILTIDDYEDDEFWLKITKNINDLVDESINFNVVHLNISIKEFFEKIENLVFNQQQQTNAIESVKYFYMIRILIQLNDKIDLVSINNNFSTLLTTQKEGGNNEKPLDLSDLVNPLLVKLFKPLTNQITSPYHKQLQKLIQNRFEYKLNDGVPELGEETTSTDEDTDSERLDVDESYPEVTLWDEYAEGDSMEAGYSFDSNKSKKLIPNFSSLQVENLVYKMSCNLSCIEENPGEDYCDVYLVDQFQGIKNELIDELIQSVGNALNGLDIAEKHVDEAGADDEEQEKVADVMDSTAASPVEPRVVDSIEESPGIDDEKQPLTKSQKKKKKQKAKKAAEAEAAATTTDSNNGTQETVQETEDAKVEKEAEQQSTNVNVGPTSLSPYLKTRTLLTYADFIFLKCFKLSNISETELSKSLSGDNEVINKLISLNEDLSDLKYRSTINRLVLDHFKSCSLMFGPLYP